jgi:hypothetical protein
LSHDLKLILVEHVARLISLDHFNPDPVAVQNGDDFPDLAQVLSGRVFESRNAAVPARIRIALS